MPISLDQIVEETREMPAEVVAELIDRIAAARHGSVEPSVATAWKTEIGKRIADIESRNGQRRPTRRIAGARAQNRWTVNRQSARFLFGRKAYFNGLDFKRMQIEWNAVLLDVQRAFRILH
jgi:hypothetical protein